MTITSTTLGTLPSDGSPLARRPSPTTVRASSPPRTRWRCGP